MRSNHAGVVFERRAERRIRRKGQKNKLAGRRCEKHHDLHLLSFNDQSFSVCGRKTKCFQEETMPLETKRQKTGSDCDSGSTPSRNSVNSDGSTVHTCTKMAATVHNGGTSIFVLVMSFETRICQFVSFSSPRPQSSSVLKSCPLLTASSKTWC